VGGVGGCIVTTSLLGTTYKSGGGEGGASNFSHFSLKFSK